MPGRWMAVGVLIWTQLALAAPADPPSHARMPGVWLEIEHAAASTRMAERDSNCSGGQRVLLRSERDVIVVPVKLDRPIESPLVYLRYIRYDAKPARVRLSVLSPPDRPAERGSAGKPVELSLTRDDEGKSAWRWVSAALPKLPAGPSTLLLQPMDEQSAVSLDVIGVIDRDTDERWIPPQAVKSGRFTDAGVVGAPLRIDQMEVRSPIRLVYGDEAIARGVTLNLTLHNVTRKPIESEVTFTVANETGELARIAGPRVTVNAGQRKSIEHRIKLPGYGWFRVTASAGQGADAGQGSIDLGVIRRPHPGVKPNSVFGLNIGNGDNDRVAAEMLGLKWRRLEIGPAHVSPKRGEYWTDAQLQQRRDNIARWKDAGVLSLGVVSYNAAWNVAPGVDGKPVPLWRNRPLDLTVQADLVYRMMKDLRRDISVWEIWNEPWVGGWTWQSGTAQDYRDMSKLIWDKVKPEMPEIMLIGGGSTSYQRDVLFAPGNKDIGYADGCSTHPYNTPDRTMPSSAAVEAVLLKRYSKSGGGAGIWATEVSSPAHNFPDIPKALRQYTVGRCVAPLYLLNRIGAAETPIRVFYFTSVWGQPDNGFNIWHGKDPTPAVVAFSAMTHFTEDATLVEDLYTQSTALWAPLLSKPDGSSVVCFWADDGFAGVIRLPAGVFQAFDHLGAPVAARGDQLAIDFTRWGVTYLVSKKPIDEVKAAMRDAEFDRLDALRINPRSFAGPIEKLPPLRLKVQNLLPRACDGQITVATPAQIELAESRLTVKGLAPGEIRWLELPLKRATASPVNRYRIDYTAVVGGQTQSGSQVIQAAYASFGTPAVDGNLDEWRGGTAVTMLSRGGKDFTEAALNPDKAAAILDAKSPTGTVAYKLWTRWDEKNLYVAAEVPDPLATFKPSASVDPEAFAFDVDNLQLAFDCLDPNPDDFFVGHPLREKCLGSEVDYEFAVARSRAADGKTEVAELHRLKAPGTNYQTIYATNVATKPPLGVMNLPPAESPQGQAAVVYDEQAKLLRYEIAIPWTCIPELGEQVRKLQSGQSHVTHFAFGVTDAGADGRGKTFWTQEAGDLQSGAYGFSPTWLGGSVRAGGRILTDWGFVR